VSRLVPKTSAVGRVLADGQHVNVEVEAEELRALRLKAGERVLIVERSDVVAGEVVGDLGDLYVLSHRPLRDRIVRVRRREAQR